MNIDPIVTKIRRCVRKHELGAGAYARYTRPNEEKGQTLAINPYGCADAANLLYTIGDFERLGDHAVNLVRVAREIDEKQIAFSPAAQAELDALYERWEQLSEEAEA